MMPRLFQSAAVLLCFISLFSLAENTPERASAAPSKFNKIYVVNNGWHTGLVVPAQPLQDLFPELKQRFANAAYLEIGWGDKGFYQTPDVTVKVALRAIFGLSGSIIHVVAIPQSPEQHFARQNPRAFCLKPQQLSALNQFIAASFYQNNNKNIIAGQAGIYGDSQFYEAVGSYHLFNTCNSWTAQSLQSAGLEISAFLKLTASSVMDALSKLPSGCAVEVLPEIPIH
ncbi:TIGR02117 family protein [Janthinobacterium sp. B9-8]|uniref:TIGR02117 family protein n=1 Tax=Janthinobacterium sp. B9-8 TaxID=1236179 RepID=UPI00069ADBB8|nr:TIGR02117 family protein [Janthinobacterium sp. B9-8]AMC33822.1 hypothetical protein VN23_04015 [Janthinobacterium sp. B9-8]